MSMLPRRPQDSFVYNRKTQQIDPINLIATDQVKCINCEKCYHYTEVQGHMMSHTNQQLRYQNIAPPLNNTNMNSQPLRLGNYNALQSSKVSSSTFDVINQPIDVKTMTDNELPQPEYKKREMQLPLPREVKLNSSRQVSYQPIGLTDRTRIQPTNQISNMQIPIQTMRQHINAGDYYVQVQLPGQPINMNLSTNAITLKRNKNLSTFIDVDNHVQLPKLQQDPIQQKNNHKRNRTYTVTPYKPQIENIDFVPISEGPKTTFKVQDNRFLTVDPPSIIGNTSKKSRTKTVDYQSDSIRPITQTPGGNLGFSRITNGIRNDVSQINNRSRQTQKSGFLSYFCGDPEDTLNNQVDAYYNPAHLNISQYQYNHNHSSSGRGCVCGTCGGFYCPQCKSTVPPQFRPCPPYLLNRQYQQKSHMNQLQTSISGITPTKSRQF